MPLDSIEMQHPSLQLYNLYVWSRFFPWCCLSWIFCFLKVSFISLQTHAHNNSWLSQTLTRTFYWTITTALEQQGSTRICNHLKCHKTKGLISAKLYQTHCWVRSHIGVTCYRKNSWFRCGALLLNTGCGWNFLAAYNRASEFWIQMSWHKNSHGILIHLLFSWRHI